MRDWQNDLYWNAIGYSATTLAALIAIGAIFANAPVLRRRFLPIPHLRPGPWRGHEVFLAFCVLIGFPSVVVTTLLSIGFFTPLIGPAPDPDLPGKDLTIYYLRCGVLSTPLGLTVTLGVLFMVLYARCGCRPHHLGLSWARWPANVVVGLAGFIVATPIVLGIHLLANFALGDIPHALSRLGEIQLEDWEWYFIAFSAIVAAPILEEIIFRGVLLGWLRRASLTGHLVIISATILFALARSWVEDPETGNLTFNPGPVIAAGVLVVGYGYWMWQLARQFQLDESAIQVWQPDPDGRPDLDMPRSEARLQYAAKLATWREKNASLAIYGSAMLFSSSHADAWPAPIAIFVLALVLGMLARRTQNLLAPIVLHAAFNLVGFITLFGGAHYDLFKNGNSQTAPTGGASGAIATSVPASQLPLRR